MECFVSAFLYLPISIFDRCPNRAAGKQSLQALRGETRTLKKLSTTLMLFAGAMVFLSLAQASAYADGIVYVSPNELRPDGVGLRTILSIQSPGSSSTESGGVKWTGSGDAIFGDATRGGTNNTVLASELGLSATNSNVIIGFNINEPKGGPGADPVTVTGMVLTAYDAQGHAVFTAQLLQSQTLTLIGNGQGTADYVFGLDAEAQQRLAAALAANPNLRLGLEATIINAQGGPESFYLNMGKGTAPVPEPTTMVLLGTGLAGLAARMRKRRKASKEE
jgi:hypothetical protein